MEAMQPIYEKYVMVCINERPAGGRLSCGGSGGGADVAGKLKEAIQAAGQGGRIRVTRTQCLGVCGQGPNILLFPDNIWFQKVNVTDIPAILEKLGIKP